MSTSQVLLDGFLKDHQNTTTLLKKPLTESQNDDVSMLIETVSGKRVNVTRPQAADISLEDIAWALSRIPRFAGHTITEIVYNVAQHSMYVSQLAEELLKSTQDFNIDESTQQAVELVLGRRDNSQFLIKALLHDAHEAYTGDIPSPIKKIPQLQETFKLIEMRLDHAIRCNFELEELTVDERTVIKYCDKLAQAIEGYQFMPSRGLSWDLPKPTLKRLQSFPQPKSPLKSYEDFISHFEYLRDQ